MFSYRDLYLFPILWYINGDSLSIVTACRHLSNVDAVAAGHSALCTVNFSKSKDLSVTRAVFWGCHKLIYKDSNDGIHAVPVFIPKVFTILVTDPGGCSSPVCSEWSQRIHLHGAWNIASFTILLEMSVSPTLVMVSSWPFAVPSEIFSNFSLASECILCSSKVTDSCYIFLKRVIELVQGNVQLRSQNFMLFL